MKVLIVLALVACATAFDFPEEWEAWKKLHSKTYDDELTELDRHSIWQANKKYIDSHNSVAHKFGYTLGMNEFGDLTSAEIVQRLNGYKMQDRSNSTRKVFKSDQNFKPSDVTVDWRKHGYVTGVKNQGQCGSCWSFSATGSLEGQHFAKTKQLVSLSEQNLVDCSGSYGNHGCEGGLMDQAFEYIKKNGIDTEVSYPYVAHEETCRFDPQNVGAHLSSYVDVESGSEASLTNAIQNVGPVSVAIDASRASFQFYKDGVYFDRDCSSKVLDHGVLAVGFGSDNGEDYYIVKNSWGTSWGDEGYIKMSRNRDNNCGIATQASYPVV